MKQNGNRILLISGAIIILLLIISLTTYAYFAAQAGGTTSTNAVVTSNTTDLLTFSINRDISFTVTQALFAENGENQSGDATATATLTPNNKTGAATMNYFLYLNIESNPTVYSATNTNEDPELMLQVFDGNNQLVTLTGLGTQKTIKGVTGYDITGLTGLKTLLDNHAISASNNTATIENWRVVITLINLDVNQNDNTGKEISAEIIIRQDSLEDPITYVYWNNGFVYEEYSDNYLPSGSGLAGTFDSREELAAATDLAYNNNELAHPFNDFPIYIRSSLLDGNVVKHEACLYLPDLTKEFCLAPNYWRESDNATMIRLKADVEEAYGIPFYDESSGLDPHCYTNGGFADCVYYGFGIMAYNNGTVESSRRGSEYGDVYFCYACSSYAICYRYYD